MALPTAVGGVGQLIGAPPAKPNTVLIRIKPPSGGGQQKYEQPGYGFRVVDGGDSNALLRFDNPNADHAIRLSTGAQQIREHAWKVFHITWPDYQGASQPDPQELLLEVFQTPKQGHVLVNNEHDGSFEFNLGEDIFVPTLAAGAQLEIFKIAPGSKDVGSGIFADKQDPTSVATNLSKAAYLTGHVYSPAAGGGFRVRAMFLGSSGNGYAFADLVSFASVNDAGTAFHVANLDTGWQIYSGAGVSFLELWTLRRLIIPTGGLRLFVVNPNAGSISFNYRVGVRDA